MPEVFNHYAKYYDLLYKEKNYEAEASYIDGLIQQYRPGAKSVLNLGCGTGKHDACLGKKGYLTCGVDLSDVMLAEAKKRAVPGKIEFLRGDVRTVNLGKKFDAVISLFHVMSYQTLDGDIRSAFRAAEKHLAAGGLFIFDFWHGPGVLNDPPVVRVKRLEDEELRIVRIAEPVLKKEQNIVDVHYQIMALGKKSGQWSELLETHSMRYFFLPEMERLLLDAGFTLRNACEWLSDKPLTYGWYGLVVANKG